MTLLRFWHVLIYLGDGAVLIPCALLLFALWMLAPATRRTGWRWLLALGAVGAGVASSKMLYMVTGWHPPGWNFIGLSGHATLAFLFWPSVAALAASRGRTWMRALAIALGAGLAIAISISSWVLRDHSVVELVLGALWGGLCAAAFLTVSWRQLAGALPLRSGLIVGLLLVTAVAFGHRFPSARVLGWIALQLTGHTAVYTRDDLGPWAQLR